MRGRTYYTYSSFEARHRAPNFFLPRAIQQKTLLAGWILLYLPITRLFCLTTSSLSPSTALTRDSRSYLALLSPSASSCTSLTRLRRILISDVNWLILSAPSAADPGVGKSVPGPSLSRRSVFSLRFANSDAEKSWNTKRNFSVFFQVSVKSSVYTSILLLLIFQLSYLGHNCY